MELSPSSGLKVEGETKLVTTCVDVASLHKTREIELNARAKALRVRHANLALVVHLSLRGRWKIARHERKTKWLFDSELLAEIKHHFSLISLSLPLPSLDSSLYLSLSHSPS